MPKAARLTAAILFLSIVVAAIPPLFRHLRLAESLRSMSLRERRIRVLGGFYEAVITLKRELPRGERVAVVFGPNAPTGVGEFLNMYLYPLETVRYGDLRGYAFAGSDSRRPSRIIYIDSFVPRLMTYGDIRAEQSGGTCVICDPQPPERLMRRFIVPIACSIDGQGNDSYVIEGVFVSQKDARLRLTLFPGGQSRDLQLRSAMPVVFRDLVWNEFHDMTVGWIAADATDDVRAALWFVNRGAGKAASLPLLTSIGGGPARLRGERLWILNAANSERSVRVDGVVRTAPPLSLSQSPVNVSSMIDCPPEVFAFATTKERDGQTRFEWPDGKR